MIEKLKETYTETTRGKITQKINELVDAVNELQESQNAYWTDIAELKKELLTHTKIAQGFKSLQDPYAEQREWIGKLCWFWCTNENYADLGILQAITPANTLNKYLKKDSSIWYSNCEPVKPDDDIIYKGDDK